MTQPRRDAAPAHVHATVLCGVLLLAASACGAREALREVRVAVAPLALEQRPVLAVQAHATREIPPDSASIELTVVAQQADESSATRAALAQSQALITALSGIVGTAELSTSKTETVVLRSERPEAHTGAWKAKLLSYRSTAQVLVARASVDAAPAIVETALAAGASAVSVELTRDDCGQVLQELRLEALALARGRAQRAARASNATLGTLYQLKESEAACPEDTFEALSITRDASPDDQRTLSPLRVDGLRSLLLSTRLSASIDVTLVYQLLGGAQAPAGEAPGEVHLGLTRSSQASSRDVQAHVTLRARVFDSDARSALQSAIERMAKVRAGLRAAGATEDELISGSASLTTQTQTLLEDGHEITRVTRYYAQVELALRSKRFAELSRFIALAGQHGATGFDGPDYELLRPDVVQDVASEAAVRQAVSAANLLANAAERDIRAVTQIRIGTWLTDPDPLFAFIEGEAGSYGRGAARLHRSMVPAATPPDEPFPSIEIHPPTLASSAEVSVGFALGASRSVELVAQRSDGANF